MDSEVVQKHRFHDFWPAEEAAVVDGAIPKNTKKAKCFWINVFDTFCREKIRFDFEKCSAEQLGQVLKRFYGGLRKKNGDVYQPGGYLAARAAIQRRLNALKRPFNVREDAAFRAKRDGEGLGRRNFVGEKWQESKTGQCHDLRATCTFVSFVHSCS